jgi:hypothetical protein
VQEHDHRASGLADDLLDQRQGMLGTCPQPDKRDVGSFPARHGPDVLDLDLSCDHLVAERHDDRDNELEPVLALVGDEHTQVLGLIWHGNHMPILIPR